MSCTPQSLILFINYLPYSSAARLLATVRREAKAPLDTWPLPPKKGDQLTGRTVTQTDNKPLVLLVEDSQDDAFLFSWALEKCGLDVCLHHAWHGGEAVEFLHQAVARAAALPKITFLDIKMPIMNGFEVLQWVRANPALTNLPVAVLSGSEQPRDKALAAKLGANEYLIKPVKTPHLMKYLAPGPADLSPSVSLSQ